jgi:hypothetical protein
MNEKFFNYSSKVDQVDQAALLVTLGFDLKDVKIINHIDLNTNNHRPREINASWTFSNTSPYCKDVGTATKVMKRFVFPARGDKAVNVCELAKIAAHNYQVMKSVILNGEKLQQIEGPNYTVLKNNNGEEIPFVQPHLILGKGASDLASVAVATALGCKVASYYIHNGELIVNVADSKEGISLAMVESEKYNSTLNDVTNFNVLPVLVSMFINREYLMRDMHQQSKAVMISRGDRMVMFGKNTSEELKRKSLKFINE